MLTVKRVWCHLFGHGKALNECSWYDVPFQICTRCERMGQLK